jgi:energy-coupling factor transporter transmembrane protein EcfT
METVLDFLPLISTFLVEWMYLLLLCLMCICLVIVIKTRNLKTSKLFLYALLATFAIMILLFTFSFRVTEKEFAFKSGCEGSKNNKYCVVSEQGLHFASPFSQYIFFSTEKVKGLYGSACKDPHGFANPSNCKTKTFVFSSEGFYLKNSDKFEVTNAISGPYNSIMLANYFAELQNNEPEFVLPSFVKEIKE